MENIEVLCPSCSPDSPVSHVVLKSDKEILLKCEECGSVHKHKKPKKVPVRVIVSDGKESLHRTTLLSGIISFGDELLVDDEKTGEVNLAEVTSIEVGERRKESAPVEDIKTIWARAIQDVTVKISVNLGETTESLAIRVPGDTEYIIGDKIRVNDRRIRIKYIKVRDGGFKRRNGAIIKAKEIKRIFAEPGTIIPKKISRKKDRVVIQKRVSEWSLRAKK